MESLKKNKILIILFIVAFLAFVVYQFGGKLNLASVTTSTPSLEDKKTTEDILSLLTKMQQVEISGDIFTATTWTSLVDYSVTLPTDPPGKTDLFNPVFYQNNISINKQATSTLP
ncbi:MAG: hypothetical protein ACYCZW_03290 [Minisyncoccota bacterium]